MVSMQELLSQMYEKGASDLHITTGIPPTVRVDGTLVQLPFEPLSPQDTKRLCYSIITEAQKQRFEEELELDLSFGVKGLSRFRANIYMQRGACAGAFRTIPFRVRPFEDLGLPPVLKELCKKPRGLVLVTGEQPGCPGQGRQAVRHEGGELLVTGIHCDSLVGCRAQRDPEGFG